MVSNAKTSTNVLQTQPAVPSIRNVSILSGHTCANVIVGTNVSETFALTSMNAKVSTTVTQTQIVLTLRAATNANVATDSRAMAPIVLTSTSVNKTPVILMLPVTTVQGLILLNGKFRRL